MEGDDGMEERTGKVQISDSLSCVLSENDLGNEEIEVKLLKYTIQNVLGVRDITFDVEGHHLFLVGGKNAQGKTSALTALLMALCGKRGLKEYPELALREGETRGSVSIELSGEPSLGLHDEKITVELTLRKKRSGEVVEDFRIVDSAGDESAEPKSLLQKLFKLRAFDPLEFERAKPKEQVEIIRNMLGIDFDAFDKRRQDAYEKRRDVGVEGKSLAGQLDGVKRHADAPDKEVSAKELMDELSRRQEANEKRNYLARTVENQKTDIIAQEDAILASHKQIEKLKNAIEVEQEKIKVAESEISAANELIAKCSSDLESKEYAEQDIEEVKRQIDGIDEANQKCRDNQKYIELQAKVEAAREEYEKLSREIKRVDEEKEQAVRDAPWPVPDMELSEDGLLLNGLPFSQASTMQRIVASTRVGMALNPTLRLLVCQHGSDLDLDALDELHDILEQQDFQMLVEIVTRTDQDERMCAVVIEDGMVKPPAAKAVTAPVATE